MVEMMFGMAAIESGGYDSILHGVHIEWFVVMLVSRCTGLNACKLPIERANTLRYIVYLSCSYALCGIGVEFKLIKEKVS